MEELTLEELQKLSDAIDDSPIEITINDAPHESLYEEEPEEEPCQEEPQDTLIQLDVVLGRTKIPVSELLSLKPGQLFPLDTLVNEPIAIEIDGEIIAFGEIVEEEGRFGILVTEKP